MLAYVFWHWPQPTIDRESYQDHLRSFHRILAADKPDGFIGSAVFRLPPVPWLGTNGSAFEDWYLLKDSAGLDVINHAAVAGNCEQPHNLVASMSGGGVAGLYGLRDGQESLNTAKFATWFAKPAGLTYKDLFSQLHSICEDGQVGLWCRQMVLGPTNEFCLHSPGETQLPGVIESLTIPLTLIWSSSTHER